MNNKLEIISMQQTETPQGCSVLYKLVINGNPYDLKYEIIAKGVTSVPDRCDGVVVTFLSLALRFGLDIHSKLPISKVLYYNIKKHFLPQLYICNPAIPRKIDINVPVTDETYSGTWRGTGISLGVDSMATIHEYSDDCLFEDYKLTHLIHLKTGAQYGCKITDVYSGENEDRLYEIEHNKVTEYCKNNNFELFTIESNLHSIIHSEFEPTFEPTCTFRNLGAILLVQNYFDKYYYASTYNLDNFSLDITSDPAHYEKWFMSLISTENITFYSANESMTRTEKVKYISQFPDTYDSLHVCWLSDKNCGHCSKCIRTLTQLDALNLLDTYKNSFDTEYYKKNRKKYLKRVVGARKTDVYYGEIYDYMKQQGIKTPSEISALPYKIYRKLTSVKGVKPVLTFIRKLLQL